MRIELSNGFAKIFADVSTSLDMTGRIRYYITGRGVRQTGQIRHDRENQVLLDKISVVVLYEISSQKNQTRNYEASGLIFCHMQSVIRS